MSRRIVHLRRPWDERSGPRTACGLRLRNILKGVFAPRFVTCKKCKQTLYFKQEQTRAR